MSTKWNENFISSAENEPHNCLYVWSDLNVILSRFSWLKFRLCWRLILDCARIFCREGPPASRRTLPRCIFNFDNQNQKEVTITIDSNAYYIFDILTLNFLIRLVACIPSLSRIEMMESMWSPFHDTTTRQPNIFLLILLVYLTMHSNYLRILIFVLNDDDRRRQHSTPIKMYKIRFYSYKMCSKSKWAKERKKKQISNDFTLSDECVRALEKRERKSEMYIFGWLKCCKQRAKHLANICKIHFITLNVVQSIEIAHNPTTA